MEHNFQPLLFGGDINVYSVARAFHEAYGIQSVCYGKFASGPAYGSTIIDYRVCPQNEDAATFRENVAKAAQEFADKTVLVIGCGDSYGSWLPRTSSFSRKTASPPRSAES